MKRILKKGEIEGKKKSKKDNRILERRVREMTKGLNEEMEGQMDKYELRKKKEVLKDGWTDGKNEARRMDVWMDGRKECNVSTNHRWASFTSHGEVNDENAT